MMADQSAGPITRALLRIAQKIDPSPPAPAEILRLRAEGKIFNGQSALTELLLAIAYGIVLVPSMLILIVAGALMPGQHEFLLTLFALLGSFLVAGNILHTIRHLWARRLYFQDYNQWQQGRRDYSDRRGARLLSSDRDLILQGFVAVLFTIWIRSAA